MLQIETPVLMNKNKCTYDIMKFLFNDVSHLLN